MNFHDSEESAKKHNIGSGEYFRPIDGENKIRIVSEYEDYGSHFIQSEKKSYACLGVDNGCPFCQQGEKVTARFLVWVIDRVDGKVKLGQLGWMVVSQIGELANNSDWAWPKGELPPFDMTITRSGQGLLTKYATHGVPNKTELTDEEKTEIAEKVTDLKAIIDKMKEKTKNYQAQPVQVESQPPVNTPPPPVPPAEVLNRQPAEAPQTETPPNNEGISIDDIPF